MPFLKPFVDVKTGAEYPNAFWYPSAFDVQYNGKSITAVYVGHVSAQLLDKDPVPAMEHVFRVSGPDFVTLLKQIAATPVNTDTPLPIAIAAMLDSIALQIKDTPTGEFDEDGNPVLVSFFEGIEPLSPDLSVLQ